MPVSKEYLVKRLVLLVFVVLGVLVITFIITRVIPARPEFLWAGPHATEEQLKRARQELHLDEPLHVQLYYYLLDFFKGSWGVSWRTRSPVLQDLLTALPATLELVVTAFTLAFLAGIPLGIYSALNYGKRADQVIRVLTILGASTPVFWVALILQTVVGIWAGLLPAGKRVDEYLVYSTGFRPITGFYLLDSLIQGNIAVFVDVLKHIIMPALVLSLYPMSLASRMCRSLMIEVLNENYIRSLEIWGVPRRVVLLKYALRNVIVPVVGSLGLSFGYTLVGAFMVELVFVWPGLGYYAGMALLSYDYPAIIGAVVLVAIFYSLINFVVDLLHAWLDPRVRL
ncbi:MAG: ABC transporter permease [Desulfurococcaceae archaeon]